jgi:hypothetical protein
MDRDEPRNEIEEAVEDVIRSNVSKGVPQPTVAFRRRAWLRFQRALDPLAPPKPFRIGRR